MEEFPISRYQIEVKLRWQYVNLEGINVMNMLKTIITCVGIISFIISLSSCSNNSNIETSSTITSSLIETPFNVILPKYLPEDLKPEPAIDGPIESSFVKGGKYYQLTYYQKTGYPRIMIREDNHESTMTINEGFNAFLEINGINVYEGKTNIRIHQSNALIEGFYYGWNQCGIHLTVSIYGYSQEECRKVVESMIK